MYSVIEALPQDVQLEFLQTLNINDLSKICQSSKYFQQLCQNERLWETLTQAHYGNILQEQNSWKQTYQSQVYQVINRWISVLDIQYFLDLLLYYFSRFIRIDKNILPEFYNPYIDHTNMDPYILTERQLGKLVWDIKYSMLGGGIGHWMYNHRIALKHKIPEIQKLFEPLQDIQNLKQFLNSPIPRLHYTTIINPIDQLNIDRFLDMYDESYLNVAPTIRDTGEKPRLTINKAYITPLDILKAAMSVKLSKGKEEVIEGLNSINLSSQELVVRLGHNTTSFDYAYCDFKSDPTLL